MPTLHLAGVSYAHVDSIPLVQDLTMRFYPGWTGIVGPNGSGKTTLLLELAHRPRIPTSRVLVLPQELSRAEGRALLREARMLASDERGRLMNIVAALGVDPGTLLQSPDPSPGEARKLALAMGLAREVWLLVLDEPTNHLDLPSILRLEEALAA